MAQIQERFTSEQVRFLFRAYVQGNMKRADVHEALGIGKSHFFFMKFESVNFSGLANRGRPCRMRGNGGPCPGCRLGDREIQGNSRRSSTASSQAA
jgi:hypothetical protein